MEFTHFLLIVIIIQLWSINSKLNLYSEFYLEKIRDLVYQIRNILRK